MGVRVSVESAACDSGVQCDHHSRATSARVLGSASWMFCGVIGLAGDGENIGFSLIG